MSSKPKICIVGAGFSGLCMGIKLKTELNLDTFTIFEGYSEVGGTWFVNTYPGCASDVPIVFYSYSFAPKPDWSRSFSYQPEILEYMKDVTKKFGIYPHIRFETRVESLCWDEINLKWKASILDDKRKCVEVDEFDIVINSTGKIRIPNYPKEYLSFQGPILHSAEWDHTINLEAKRVGLIGTGASGVQIVTAIADKVGHLTVFQRKAPHVLPRPQFAIPKTAKWTLTYIPMLNTLVRQGVFWAMELTYTITRHNATLNKIGNVFSRWFRNFQMSDAHLRKKTTPDFAFACKRVILSENYYTKLSQPNVNLITSQITGVSGNILSTEDGENIELDVLVLATGYRNNDFFYPMKVYGKNGVDVLDEWINDRPKCYMGISSTLMSNFFTILGPFSLLGHSSNVFTIECQVHWTILAIKAMLERNARCITITKKAEDEFMKFLDEKWKKTVWGNEQCGSWYLNTRGENTTMWPDHQLAYWNWCKSLDADLFDFIH